MSMSFWWNLETFTCTLGVISSLICFGVDAARSRSRRRRSRRTTEAINRDEDDIAGIDISTRSPTAVSSRIPVPASPPLTVYTEYRYDVLPPIPSNPPPRSPTSPVSSKDNFPPPSEAISRILRSCSLPPQRRRKRHHRSHRSPSMLAPITFTETVTLQEAPRHASPSSSPARPMASSIRPPVRNPPVRPPSKVDLTTKAKSSAASRPAQKPDPTIVSDSEYTYAYQTSSEDSDVSEDKSIDKTPLQAQVRHPLQLDPETIPKIPTLDTLELQTRVIMSKACDPSISPAAFNEYLLKNNFSVWNPKETTDAKPYRMLCIFGPPNIGKSSAAGGMNTFVQGVQVTTTSKKFYKYVNESTNSNMYHFCNDSFSSPSGINWDRLLQSINSISHGIGRHFIIVEGHRLFECDALLDDADYVVTLTALPSTLRCRPEPTAEESLQLYISRVRSHLQALNDSKGIMKINGISSPEIVIKKIGAFIALKNKGLQHPGRRLSDTKALLETSVVSDWPPMPICLRCTMPWSLRTEICGKNTPCFADFFFWGGDGLVMCLVEMVLCSSFSFLSLRLNIYFDFRFHNELSWSSR